MIKETIMLRNVCECVIISKKKCLLLKCFSYKISFSKYFYKNERCTSFIWVIWVSPNGQRHRYIKECVCHYKQKHVCSLNVFSYEISFSKYFYRNENIKVEFNKYCTCFKRLIE